MSPPAEILYDRKQVYQTLGLGFSVEKLKQISRRDRKGLPLSEANRELARLFFKVGRSVKVRKRDLDAWIMRHRNGVHPRPGLVASAINDIESAAEKLRKAGEEDFTDLLEGVLRVIRAHKGRALVDKGSGGSEPEPAPLPTPEG